MDEILDVATEVELEAYEGSEFHDRLQRARLAAGGQSSAVVFGLVTVDVDARRRRSASSPCCWPSRRCSCRSPCSGYMPIAFVNVRNNRARYGWSAELTELQRDRSYLEYLMTDRAEAKEVRAYEHRPDAAPWHADLWDTRMRKLRDLVAAADGADDHRVVRDDGRARRDAVVRADPRRPRIDHDRRRSGGDRRSPAAQRPAAIGRQRASAAFTKA